MNALRILVVEDDASIGGLLSEVLEDLGHTVCGLESSAANAVTAAARLQPDLMIVDVGLGDASGVSAVESILRQRFVPHVFVTGDAVRSLSLGTGAILIQKPFRAAAIVAAIETALEGSTARRALALSVEPELIDTRRNSKPAPRRRTSAKSEIN